MEGHAQFDELLFYAKLFSVVGFPLIFAVAGWLLVMDQRARHIKRVTDQLLQMHLNPESTGFGTVGMKDVVEDNTRAIKGLSQMLRWFMENETGKTMPPFPDVEIAT